VDSKGARRCVWERSLGDSVLAPLLVFFISAAIAGVAFMLPVAMTSQAYVNSRLYLYGTIAQFLMDVPALFLLARSGWAWLGDKRECRNASAEGLVGAALLGALRIGLGDRLVFMGQVPAFGQGLSLPVPWNILTSAFTVLAYGPGEALIQVYLIRAFDRVTGHERRLISLGVVANALLWGLGHIGAVVTDGWSAVSNALLMLTIGVVTGVMFKKTRSAAAPMVFWALVNGTSV
jgi:hypothetical protein